MHWLDRGMWKAGIAIAGILLLLVLMTWIQVSVAGAHERVSELAGSGAVTVQETPTVVDATVAALNKEKLAQEVQQLKNQNEPDPLGWLRTNASILLSTLVVVIGGLIGLFRWLRDRRDAQEKELKDRLDAQEKELKDRQNEREKRAEERFQAAVTGLGDVKEGAKIGAAILLRTFLRPDYKDFYTQTFDLAVANLRLRNVDSNKPEPPDTLNQALITVFKESFPLARDRLEEENLEEENPQFSSQSLDARGIHLDMAFISKADMKQAWMPQAFIRSANLSLANLIGANLIGANLIGANLSKANLSKADLSLAELNGTDLSEANLRVADLIFANLSEANLRVADLNGADLNGANLIGANLSEADLSEANLSKADLSEAGLSEADLSEADLSGAKGMTDEELEIYIARGAIINKDLTTSSSQSAVSTPPPLQRNNAQAPSAPSAQESIPAPDTGGNNAASSQKDQEL